MAAIENLYTYLSKTSNLKDSSEKGPYSHFNNIFKNSIYNWSFNDSGILSCGNNLKRVYSQ